MSGSSACAARKAVAIALLTGTLTIISSFASSASPADSTRPAPQERAPQAKSAPTRIKDRPIRWAPPSLDVPDRSVSSSQPCPISSVLLAAGSRAQNLVRNVQSFTADERIQYEGIDRMGGLAEAESGTFQYVAVLVPDGAGWIAKETRTSVKGSHSFPASSLDIGLPELALIFLPNYQEDYNMTCEGAAQWNGEAAWVIRFQQRPDKPAETLSIGGTDPLVRLKLNGRAWLAADSGEVLHLESDIMEPVIALHLQNWWLSIDYGPVQFQSRNVRMWLPQAVDAYAEFVDHRTVIYHTFANFLLFSVGTHQEVGKPTQPH